MLVLLLFVCASTALSTNAAMVCNGLAHLCDLRINQATFPGTHNSGSGFDGVLYYWSGGPASSCFYRNQGASFAGQLTFGIRYFDVDTCFGNGKVLNCHCDGDICAYTGSMDKAMQQIDTWMKAHPNEVIIIHFNSNAQKLYRKEIANALTSTLSNLWNPSTTTKVAMNTHYHASRQWPTLREAIQSKRRIFVFMDNNLYQYLPHYRDWLISSNSIMQSTWGTNPVSSSCSGITSNAQSKCTSPKDFVELSAFGSYGLCTWHMATICSKWLEEALDECYKLRHASGRTVNILLVDWATEYYSSGESVVNKAKIMNQKNIKQYCYSGTCG